LNAISILRGRKKAGVDLSFAFAFLSFSVSLALIGKKSGLWAAKKELLVKKRDLEKAMKSKGIEVLRETWWLRRPRRTFATRSKRRRSRTPWP